MMDSIYVVSVNYYFLGIRTQTLQFGLFIWVWLRKPNPKLSQQSGFAADSCKT